VMDLGAEGRGAVPLRVRQPLEELDGGGRVLVDHRGERPGLDRLDGAFRDGLDTPRQERRLRDAAGDDRGHRPVPLAAPVVVALAARGAGVTWWHTWPSRCVLLRRAPGSRTRDDRLTAAGRPW